uniref:Uncharacterized protein n=1 Tax=Arundo donax TaxID=35708 RepID=A0A0A9BHK1_ARUDO
MWYAYLVIIVLRRVAKFTLCGHLSPHMTTLSLLSYHSYLD